MSTQGFAAVHSCTLPPSLFQPSLVISELVVAPCLSALGQRVFANKADVPPFPSVQRRRETTPPSLSNLKTKIQG